MDLYRQIVAWLIAAGHVASSWDIDRLVSRGDIGVAALDVLIGSGLDVSLTGSEAMVRAACDENYSLIQLLHNSGVQITVDGPAPGSLYDGPIESNTLGCSLLRLIASGLHMEESAPSLQSLYYCLGLTHVGRLSKIPPSALNEILIGTLESHSSANRLAKCMALVERGADLSWPNRPGLIERFLRQGYTDREEDVLVLRFLVMEGAPLTRSIVALILQRMRRAACSLAGYRMLEEQLRRTIDARACVNASSRLFSTSMTVHRLRR